MRIDLTNCNTDNYNLKNYDEFLIGRFRVKVNYTLLSFYMWERLDNTYAENVWSACANDYLLEQYNIKTSFYSYEDLLKVINYLIKVDKLAIFS